MKRIQMAIFAAAVAGAVAWASSASAQQFTAFPTQNPLGPTGAAYQTNYPYPGQCVADSTQAALFPGLPACSTAAGASSFACDGSSSNRTAGGWAACNAVSKFQTLAPVIPNSAPTPGAVATPRFVWEMLNPPDYAPDRTTFPNADYYEIILHEAWGFQAAAGLDLFPDPTVGVCSITGAYCDAASLPAGCGSCNAVFPGAPPVPNGMQWTGLTCNSPGGCSCPADLAAGAFKSAYCNVGGATAAASPAGRVPYGYPLYTPIWGVGIPPERRRPSRHGDLLVGERLPGDLAVDQHPRQPGHAGRREVGERVPEHPRPLPVPRRGGLAVRDRPHVHGREGPDGPGRPPGNDAQQRTAEGRRREPLRQSAAAGQFLGDPPARRRDPSVDRRLRREVVRQPQLREDLQRGGQARHAGLRERVGRRAAPPQRQLRHVHVSDGPGGGDHLVPRSHPRQDPPQRDRGPRRLLPREGAAQARQGRGRSLRGVTRREL